VGEKVSPADDFGADKALLDIGVNGAGGFPGGAVLTDAPGAVFLAADGKEVDETGLVIGAEQEGVGRGEFIGAGRGDRFGRDQGMNGHGLAFIVGEVGFGGEFFGFQRGLQFEEGGFFGIGWGATEAGFDEFEIFEDQIRALVGGHEDGVGVGEGVGSNEIDLGVDLFFGFDELIGLIESGVFEVMFTEVEAGVSGGMEEAESHDSGGGVGCGSEEGGGLAFHGGGPDANVCDATGIVERSDADGAGGEGFIFGDHDGGFEVIEPDFDEAGGGLAFETNPVPGVQAPVDSGAGFAGDPGARGVMDEEDIMGMVVGGAGEVYVVEVGGVLEAEEEAEVAVWVVFAGLEQVTFEDEIAELAIGDERDIGGGSDGGLVLALFGEFERPVGGAGEEGPGLGIAHDEVVEGLGGGESLFVLEGEFGWGIGWVGPYSGHGMVSAQDGDTRGMWAGVGGWEGRQSEGGEEKDGGVHSRGRSVCGSAARVRVRVGRELRTPGRSG
jgi:hypothetical protein